MKQSFTEALERKQKAIVDKKGAKKNIVSSINGLKVDIEKDEQKLINQEIVGSDNQRDFKLELDKKIQKTKELESSMNELDTIEELLAKLKEFS